MKYMVLIHVLVPHGSITMKGNISGGGSVAGYFINFGVTASSEEEATRVACDAAEQNPIHADKSAPAGSKVTQESIQSINPDEISDDIRRQCRDPDLFRVWYASGLIIYNHPPPRRWWQFWRPKTPQLH